MDLCRQMSTKKLEPGPFSLFAGIPITVAGPLGGVFHFRTAVPESVHKIARLVYHAGLAQVDGGGVNAFTLRAPIRPLVHERWKMEIAADKFMLFTQPG